MAAANSSPRPDPRGRPAPGRAAPGTTVRNWLRGIGAPIVQVGGTEGIAPPLEEIVIAGLHLVHTDASLARGMPIVLWRNRPRLRFDELTRAARQAGEGATLGFFLDLTAKLTNDRELAEIAHTLEDTRSPSTTFFFTGAAATVAGRELADIRTPAVARRWRFLMNMPFESFETLFRKHGGMHGTR